MTDAMDTNIGLCGGPRISFEFFPPKSGAADAALWDAVNRLGRLNPLFFSVTYGAGGGSRDRTADIAEQIAAKTGIPAAAHLAASVRPATKSTRWHRHIGSGASAISSHCAAMRSLGPANTRRIRMDIPMPSIWSAG